ncbi:hypothetical protein Tco_1238175 [Tanacetum coccineum]
MSSYNHPGCSYCGDPFNGGNCPSCSSVGSGNEFVYDPNPYSYNETPNFFNQPPQHQYETYSCEFCGNDAHYGYDCPPQVPFISNPDPCYNQDFDNFPQTSPDFQQQYLCCENCGGPHETFQCQPLNQNFYEPNLCYNSIASGFDQFQPLQFPVIHQPPQETSVEILQARENLMKSIQTFLKKFNRISFRETPKELADYINTPNWNCPAFYEDDDEEYTIAITPVLPTEEPDNSLSMGDEHLSTILETKSDELIKSSVENLVPIPSESEDFSDIESECDVPVCDDFTTVSNPLFDADDNFSSSDDESFSDEDVPKKIYSNPLSDEEIISTKIDLHHFNAESVLMKEIISRIVYDINSSPRPPEESNSKISDATIKSSSPSLIPIEDSDSLIEEIDLFLDPDDSIPPGIESDNYDSEGGFFFLDELLGNDSIPGETE